MDQDANEWKTFFMRANQLLRATIHPASVQLPVEGELPSLGSATGWLNSQPLTEAGLHGKVVLIDFWTYTCINWLRSLPYVRAWAEKYKDQGLTVIGVHAPEFEFEKNVDNVRRAAEDMRVDYPIAIDNEYAIWMLSTTTIGQLSISSTRRGIFDIINSARTNTNYVSYERTENFASPGGAALDTPRVYAAPTRLRLNHWALWGDWTVERQATVLNKANGRIAYRFHARDLHLVMGPAARGDSVRFQVLIDGQPPGADHGIDVDDQGDGTVTDPGSISWVGVLPGSPARARPRPRGRPVARRAVLAQRAQSRRPRALPRTPAQPLWPAGRVESTRLCAPRRSGWRSA